MPVSSNVRRQKLNRRCDSRSLMKTIQAPAVANKFVGYPSAIRAKLMYLRQIILETAAETDGVGSIEETLKWSEPAYVTSATGSGSTIRIDWKKKEPNQYAMYFNCKTNLVETFRTLFPNDFTFEGNRAIVFQDADEIPTDSLKFCIAAALTYHLKSSRAPKVAR